MTNILYSVYGTAEISRIMECSLGCSALRFAIYNLAVRFGSGVHFMIPITATETEKNVAECSLMAYHISLLDFSERNDFKFYFHYDWGSTRVWSDFPVITC